VAWLPNYPLNPTAGGRRPMSSATGVRPPRVSVSVRRTHMKSPWSVQLASDVVRDGLGLELLGEPHRVVAEVFRCDADHTVTVRLFEDGIPDDVLDEFVQRARERLDPFEDGTPLPESFAHERAVVPHQ
jgi:hypothetical protein